MKIPALAALLSLLAVTACEGPVGPQGPQGPQGQVEEGTFIRVGNLTLALYDGFGRIIFEDRRITPTSYRGICVRVSIEDQDYTTFFKPPHSLDLSISVG